MALIKCPECQNSISDKAASCPYCGLPAEYYRTLDAVDPPPAKVNAPQSAPKAAKTKKTATKQNAKSYAPEFHIVRKAWFSDNKNEGLFKNAPDDLPIKMWQTLYELFAKQEGIVIHYELNNPKTGTTIKGTTGEGSEIIYGEPAATLPPADE